MRPEEQAELIAFLNEQDAKKTRRRKPHHLPTDRYLGNAYEYHLSLCARHHGQPFLNEGLAQELVSALNFYRKRGDLLVYAYCVMPDHIHIVCKLQRRFAVSRPRVVNGVEVPAGVFLFMQLYKRWTSRRAHAFGIPAPLWQRDFYDRIRREKEDMSSLIRYVLENPIRRGLTKEIGEWKWAGTPDPA